MPKAERHEAGKGPFFRVGSGGGLADWISKITNEGSNGLATAEVELRSDSSG